MVDWGLAWDELNLVATIVGALAPFLVGFIYYSDKVLLKPWAKEVGLSKKDIESPEGMPQIFGATLVMNIATSLVLGLLMTGTEGWVDGLVFGAIIGAAFGAATMTTHYLFARKSARLMMIDAGNTLLALALMGVAHGLIN